MYQVSAWLYEECQGMETWLDSSRWTWVIIFLTVCSACWGPSSPFQTPTHPLKFSPNDPPLTLQRLWIASIPFFIPDTPKNLGCDSSVVLSSSPLSCLPTRICNSCQSVIHFSCMYQIPVRCWGCPYTLERCPYILGMPIHLVLTFREFMVSWGRRVCSWITVLQQLGNACRGHSRSSVICNQVQAPCRQNSSSRFPPVAWNQTPCFRCESTVPQKYIVVLQSFDRRMLGKGSADT